MELTDNIQLLNLELFDAAFPVAPGDEDETKRRFMLLFLQTDHARRGGSAEIFRATNALGETFAVKRLRLRNNDEDVATDSDSLHAEEGRQRTPMGKTPEAVSLPPEETHREARYRTPTDETPEAVPKPIETHKVLHASFDSRSGSVSNTPSYVTTGHAAAFYEEYRLHCTVSNLQGFPNVYGFGIADGRPLIVMEWVEGSNLRDTIRSMKATNDDQTVLPLETVAEFGIAVLDVLERATNLDTGLIHRDLSPRNIMLRSRTIPPDEQMRTGKFDICLIDFGTAQQGAEGAPDFTRQAGIWRMGTPDYAPPEMLSADIDLPEGYRRAQAIDTYALSSILYELYTGQKPYRLSPSDSVSPYRTKTETLPNPIEPREPDGGAFAAAIMTGLSTQQSDRPDIAQLKAALKNWKRLPSQSRIGSLDGAKPAKTAFWQPGYADKLVTRRRFIAGGIVAAAAIVATAIVASRPQAQKRIADPARYTRADGPYAGDPLFKALDANLPGWMLCSASGDIVCKPDSSRECGALRDGLVALYDDISELWGYIVPGSSSDSNADAGSAGYGWAILPAFAQAADFSEGLAAAQDPNTGLWGFIGTDGNWSIAPQFSSTGAFSNGAAAVQAARSDSNTQASLWGAIDTAGSFTVEPAFAELGSLSADGFAVAQEASGSWGIVDAAGAWQSETRFPQLRRFNEGLAPAKDKMTQLWGFIESDGNWAVDPIFRNARPFYEGLAAVQDETTQLWYFIEVDGAAANGTEPRFWKLGDLHDGLAPAQASDTDSVVIFDENDPDAYAEGAGKRYGYVDASGQWQMRRLTTLVDTAIGSPAI